MNRIYRECNVKGCNRVNEIGYHRYKNDTKHIAMICPEHKYKCLPYEELELRDFNEVKIEYYTKKHSEYLEKKESKKARQAQKIVDKAEKTMLERLAEGKNGLTATELLSL